MLEMILMQLRLNEGLSIEAFQTRTGHDPRLLFGETLECFVRAGLIARRDGRIALTRAGFLQANYVIAELAGSIQNQTTATA
jgi:oxygen-independent coproporphyrinogen-3 oxidase